MPDSLGKGNYAPATQKPADLINYFDRDTSDKPLNYKGFIAMRQGLIVSKRLMPAAIVIMLCGNFKNFL
jgi:hypothetical protein